MEQSANNKLDLKEKFLSFYNFNKIKIFIFFSLSFIAIIFISFTQLNQKKNNSLVAEKYVKAGIYLDSGNKEKSRDILVEIVQSKNSFYSILALNTIIEKKLISDKDKIVNYFQIIEKMNIDQETQDLINLKKGLYLIKNNNLQDGENILKKLIENNSKIKFLAEEILAK